MLDFKHLEIFIKVAELRSFNRAAGAPNTTQLVTPRIIRLEDRVPARLRPQPQAESNSSPRGGTGPHGRAAFHAVAGSALRGRAQLGVAENHH
jgi:hypothetical protein